ncbi:MAG: hypothetical protein HYS22_03210 [Deltaproteobacteria bacterium]|nr:hypothetical protein [Deltaproteobacteria bacterium]
MPPPKAVSAQQIRDFYTTFLGPEKGKPQPIDLSSRVVSAEEAGFLVRNKLEEIRRALVKDEYNYYDVEGKFGFVSLRNKPIFPDVFWYISQRDCPKDVCEPTISVEDIGLSLVEAGLLILPRVQEEPKPATETEPIVLNPDPSGQSSPPVATLGQIWNNKGMIRWKVKNAPSIPHFEEWLKLPGLSDEDRLFLIDSFNRLDSVYARRELSKALMEEGGPQVRTTYLKRFRISHFNGGFFLGNLATTDFDPLLAKLVPSDMKTIHEILGSDDPQQVAFGLLCAARLLNHGDFLAIRQEVLDKKTGQGLLFTSNRPNPGQEVTLTDFANYLLQAYFGDFSTTDKDWVDKKTWESYPHYRPKGVGQ